MLLKTAQRKLALCCGMLLLLGFSLFPQAGFADSPKATGEFRDPLLREQLPPATRLLIIGLIYIAQLDGGRSSKRREVVIDDQVALLRRLLEIIEQVYGKRNEAIPVSKKISSLADAIYLLEPTRGRTGDGFTDIERLLNAEQAPPRAVKESAVLDRNNYQNPLALSVVKRWLHKRNRLLHDSLTNLTTNKGATQTLAQAIMAGLFGGMINNIAGPSGVTSLARKVEAGALKAKEKRLERAARKDRGDGAASEAETDPGEIEDVVASLAGVFADNMEKALAALASEETVLDLVRELNRADNVASGDANLEGFIIAFQKQLNTVVKDEVYAITKRIVHHFKGNLAAGQRDTLEKVLEVLFDEYLKQAEPYVIKNILIDLLNSPVNATEEDAFRIVVKHFGPIVKNLLQTIGHIANIGPLQMICKSLQDSGAGVSFETAQEIINADPNHYKLEFFDDREMSDLNGVLQKLASKGAVAGKTIVNMNKRFMKAGKIAQVHSAYLYWQNAEGGYELRPIVVRILIPGATKMLQEERGMLLKLSEKLASVFTDYAGRVARTSKIHELINTLYEHLNRETDLALTVKNQNIAGVRLKSTFDVSFKHTRTQGVIDYDVPFAYPAEQQSQVMLMDLVDVHPLDEDDETQMEVARKIGGCFFLSTVQQLLLKPLCEKQEVTEAREDEGFAHGDPHMGNLLLGKPYTGADGKVHYPVHITDLGLVVWVPKDKLVHLARLQMGANFNSPTLIAHALWNLRDDNPDYKNDVDCQSHFAILMEVNRVVKHLKKQYGASRYWGAGDWIKQFWLYSQLNFPSWLLEAEQVFRALNSTLETLGLEDADMRKLYADLGANYTWPMVKAGVKAGPTTMGMLGIRAMRYCGARLLE